MDYYKILGISKNAPREKIREAFRGLAHKYHPDKGGDAKKFIAINEAYQVLGNAEKRAEYDKSGKTFKQQGGFNGKMTWADFVKYAQGQYGFIQSDPFGVDLGDVGDIFSEIAGSAADEVDTNGAIENVKNLFNDDTVKGIEDVAAGIGDGLVDGVNKLFDDK